MTTENRTVKVRQVCSTVRRNRRQALYLKSLGLHGIGTERTLTANNSVSKLIQKISHLVKVISE